MLGTFSAALQLQDIHRPGKCNANADRLSRQSWTQKSPNEDVKETQYSVTEQEYQAMVDSMRHFHIYLTGVVFTIVTNHSSLQFLDRLKDHNSRLTCWALSLQPYSYRIIHQPGKCNANADRLS